MSLAKTSMEIAERYLPLVPDEALATRVFSRLREEHDRAVAGVLEIVETHDLLDRQPVIQQSVRLRNPYVDPMNAIQVELLQRFRGGRRVRAAAAAALDRGHCGCAPQHRLTRPEPSIPRGSCR